MQFAQSSSPDSCVRLAKHSHILHTGLEWGADGDDFSVRQFMCHALATISSSLRHRDVNKRPKDNVSLRCNVNASEDGQLAPSHAACGMHVVPGCAGESGFSMLCQSSFAAFGHRAHTHQRGNPHATQSTNCSDYWFTGDLVMSTHKWYGRSRWTGDGNPISQFADII